MPLTRNSSDDIRLRLGVAAANAGASGGMQTMAIGAYHATPVVTPVRPSTPVFYFGRRVGYQPTNNEFSPVVAETFHPPKQIFPCSHVLAKY
jgi:hypothetical protein